MDECTTKETNDCDSNALCSNTDGSYVCRCNVGYFGDGRNCTGKSELIFFFCGVGSCELYLCGAAST